MTKTAPISTPEAGKARPYTGAHALIDALKAQGADVLFGYPGGAIMPVYDALPGSGLTHILMRHEQAAAFAADAYARVSGKAGICLATSGPGGTNLVTGLANAHLDSVPVIAITGQVARPLMGTDAFQEVDIFGITLPIVKHSYIVNDSAEIGDTIAEAFSRATSGRPGPILIDLPKDVAAGPARPPDAIDHRTYKRASTATHQPDKIAKAQAMVRAAKQPILYVGGGVAIARAEKALQAFAKASGIPAVASLKGLGAIPDGTPLFLGMLGMHGTKAANLAVQDCDLLICCGARFDDRATGRLDGFAPNARILHLDGDAAEIGKLKQADLAILGNMDEVLLALSAVKPEISSWQAKCLADKSLYQWRYDAPGEKIYAPALLRRLSERASSKMIISCDVGQHQMWVAQHCRFTRPQAHLTSGGLGAMGYGIPAGIGALYAETGAQVVTVTGDGSIMMNLQELATINRYKLPLKIVLLDNQALGMVRQWQELFFNGNYSEVDLSDNPDFAALARVFGLDAFTISKQSEVDNAIDRLLGCDGPCLMHVEIDPMANVWPLVPPGAANHTMMEEGPQP